MCIHYEIYFYATSRMYYNMGMCLYIGMCYLNKTNTVILQHYFVSFMYLCFLVVLQFLSLEQKQIDWRIIITYYYAHGHVYVRFICDFSLCFAGTTPNGADAGVSWVEVFGGWGDLERDRERTPLRVRGQETQIYLLHAVITGSSTSWHRLQ